MTEPTRISVNSITDFVEVIPTLLGFHPHESVVLLAIDHGEVVVTARTDAGACERGLAPALSSLWQRYPAALFWVFGFCSVAMDGWRAVARLDAEMPRFLHRRLIAVDETRWYDTPASPGVGYDRHGSVHLVRAAYAGKAVLNSRAELVSMIEPTRSVQEMAASWRRVRSSVGAISDLCTRAAEVIQEAEQGCGHPSWDDVTVLCQAAEHLPFLDEQLWALTAQRAQRQRDLWLQVVRGSPLSRRSGALVALGLSSWLCGDGALQVVCLEDLRARTKPSAWIDLLDLINSAALSPQHWGALVAEHGETTVAAPGVER